jgi:hypothetical protein
LRQLALVGRASDSAKHVPNSPPHRPGVNSPDGSGVYPASRRLTGWSRDWLSVCPVLLPHPLIRVQQLLCCACTTQQFRRHGARRVSLRRVTEVSSVPEQCSSPGTNWSQNKYVLNGEWTPQRTILERMSDACRVSFPPRVRYDTLKPLSQGTRVLSTAATERGKQPNMSNESHRNYRRRSRWAQGRYCYIPRGWDVTPSPKGSCSFPLAVHSTQTGDVTGGKKR